MSRSPPKIKSNSKVLTYETNGNKTAKCEERNSRRCVACDARNDLINSSLITNNTYNSFISKRCDYSADKTEKKRSKSLLSLKEKEILILQKSNEKLKKDLAESISYTLQLEENIKKNLNFKTNSRTMHIIIAEKDKENLQLKKKIEKAENAFQEINAKYQSIEINKAEKVQQICKKEKEIQVLNSKVKLLCTKLESQTSQEEINEKMDGYLEELRNNQNKIEDLAKELHIKDAKIINTEKELKAVSKKLLVAEDELLKAQKCIEHTQKMNFIKEEEIKTKMNDSTNEIKISLAKSKILEDELFAKQKVIMDLQNQLALTEERKNEKMECLIKNLHELSNKFKIIENELETKEKTVEYLNQKINSSEDLLKQKDDKIRKLLDQQLLLEKHMNGKINETSYFYQNEQSKDILIEKSIKDNEIFKKKLDDIILENKKLANELDASNAQIQYLQKSILYNEKSDRFVKTELERSWAKEEDVESFLVSQQNLLQNLLQQKDEMQQQLDDFTTKLKKNNEKIEKNEEILTVANKKIEELSSGNSKLFAERNEFIFEIKEMNELKEDHESSKLFYLRKINMLEVEGAKRTEEMNIFFQSLQKQIKENEDLKEKINELEEHNETNLILLKKAEKNLAFTEDALCTNEEGYNVLKVQFKKLENKTKNLYEKNEENLREIENKTEEINVLKRLLDESKNDLLNATQNVNLLQDQINDFNLEKNHFQKHLESINNENCVLRKERNDLLQQLKLLTEEKKNLLAMDFKSQKKKLEDLNETKKSMENLIDKLKNANKSYKYNIDNLNNELNKHNELIKIQSLENVHLKNLIDEKEKNIVDLTQALKEGKCSFEILENKYKNAKMDLENISTSETELGKIFQEMLRKSKKINLLEEHSKDLQNQNDLLKLKVTDLESKIINIEEIKPQLLFFNEQLQAANDLNKDLLKDVNTYSLKMAHMLFERERLTEKISEYEIEMQRILSENSKLVGHTNIKQKIHYVENVTAENLALRKKNDELCRSLANLTVQKSHLQSLYDTLCNTTNNFKCFKSHKNSSSIFLAEEKKLCNMAMNLLNSHYYIQLHSLVMLVSDALNFGSHRSPENNSNFMEDIAVVKKKLRNLISNKIESKIVEKNNGAEKHNNTQSMTYIASTTDSNKAETSRSINFVNNIFSLSLNDENVNNNTA